MNDKISYGLKNVHYAKLTDTAGAITYGKPVPLKGGVSISITPEGELVEVSADDITYWSSEVNNGYSGEVELLIIPEQFRTDILGDELVDGVLYESSEQKGSKFALMFEFNGDVHARRHVLYNCTATRPTIASSTKGATVEPQTKSLAFNARPRIDNYLIKADTATDGVPYNTWFTSVHEKSVVLAP